MNTEAPARAEIPADTSITYTTQQTEVVARSRVLALFRNVGPELARWMDEEGLGALEAAMVHAVRVTPKLAECSPSSMIAAIKTCAELNLMPGQQGHIYLIPYGSNVQIQIGYKGYAELGMRSGMIRSLEAGPIYQCELDHPGFKYQRTPAVLVIPGILSGQGRTDDKVVGAYCRVQLANGGELIEVIDRAEIDARRARGKASGSNTPWTTDFARMARKSAVRKLFAGGTVPMSTEMQTALQIESIEAAQLVEVEQVARPARTLLDVLEVE